MRRWAHRIAFWFSQERRAILHIALPLGILFTASISLHIFNKDDQFFLNLSTEIVGILITVWYINTAIQKLRREHWSNAFTAIASDLCHFLRHSMESLAHSLHTAPFGTHIYPATLREDPVRDSWREYVAESWIRTYLPQLVARAKPVDLKNVIRSLFEMHEEAGNLAARYGSVLPEPHYRILVEIRLASYAAATVHLRYESGVDVKHALRAVDETHFQYISKDDIINELGNVFRKLLEMRSYVASHGGPYGL